MVARLINVGRHVRQSEGINLPMPGIGTTGKRYLKTDGSVGCASPVGRPKVSHIMLKLPTKPSPDTSKMRIISLKTALQVSSNSKSPQLMTTPSQLSLASLIGNFLSCG